MRPILFGPLTVAAMLWLVACGPASKPAIQTFTATPASLPYGGGSVQLQWQVQDAQTLSIDNSVGDVTKVQQKQAAVTVSQTTVFTLTATNARGPSTAQVTVNVATTATVTGKVIGTNGEPASGLAVVIGSLPPATTAADGTFTIPNVTPPYDAVVVANSSKLAYVYKGLRRINPTLQLRQDFGNAQRVTLQGSVSGGTGFPTGSSTTTEVAFSSPEAPGWTPLVDSTTGSYSGTGAYPQVTWFGPASTTGTLHALQFQVDGQGMPNAYNGYGRLDGVTLTAPNSSTLGPVALSPVGSDVVSGSITLPGGYSSFSRNVQLVLGQNTLPLAFDTSSGAAFAYLAPTSIAPVSVTVQTNGPNGERSLRRKIVNVPAANVTVDVAAAPQLTLPVDTATGITTTTSFAWAGLTQGVHEVVFNPKFGSATDPQIHVITTGTTTTIPDLTALGMPLPTGTAYVWRVRAYAPYTDIDAATGPASIRDTPDRDGTVADSGSRSFTTGP